MLLIYLLLFLVVVLFVVLLVVGLLFGFYCVDPAAGWFVGCDSLML